MPLTAPDQNTTFVSPIGNSDMQIWQRGTDFDPIANQTYGPDMWKFRTVGGGTMQVQQAAEAPSSSGLFTGTPLWRGFGSSCKITSIIAEPSPIGAASIYSMHQSIDGYNFRPLANNVGLGQLPANRKMFAYFLMQTNFQVVDGDGNQLPATFSLSLRNGGADRYFVAPINIIPGSNWNLYSFEIPPNPSSGTWDFTTGVGLQFQIVFAAGANFLAPAAAVGSWNTGALVAVPNQSNFMANAGFIVHITGIYLLPFNQPRPPYRTFQEDLAFCQSWYAKSFPYDVAPAQNAGVAGAFRHPQNGGAGVNLGQAVRVPYPVRMIRPPTTVTLYNPSAANALIRNLTTGTDYGTSVADNASELDFALGGTTPAGSAFGQPTAVHWTADCSP